MTFNLFTPMKNFKNLITGTFLLCLVTACSKEEPQNCNCNAPKTIKKTIKGELFTNSERNLEIIEHKFTIGVYRTIICNQTHLRNLLKQTTINKDSIVSIEANTTDCYSNTKPRTTNGIFIFLDVISVQKDSIK